MAYSDSEDFPPDIIENFSVSFKEGDYVIKQGEKTRDILYCSLRPGKNYSKRRREKYLE